MTELHARAVTVRFGGLTAVDDVTLSLAEGEVLGLIGPNGAGKTTLVNVLSGFQRPATGTIRSATPTVPAFAATVFPASGIVRTFQAVRLFRGLTVSENVEIGYRRARPRPRRRAPAGPRCPRGLRACGEGRPARLRAELRRGAAGRASPARSPSTRAFCCSTSRPPDWPPPKPTSSATSSGKSGNAMVAACW